MSDWSGGPAVTVPPKPNYQGSPAQRPPLSWVQAETRRILANLPKRVTDPGADCQAGLHPHCRPEGSDDGA